MVVNHLGGLVGGISKCKKGFSLERMQPLSDHARPAQIEKACLSFIAPYDGDRMNENVPHESCS